MIFFLTLFIFNFDLFENFNLNRNHENNRVVCDEIRTTPVLAIDYGPRLIGLAYSNKLNEIIPFKTIQNNRNLTDVSYKICDYIFRLGVGEVIVGVPTDKNRALNYQANNFNARLCLDFSKVLCSVIENVFDDIPVFLFDEAFTTREAKLLLKQNKGHSLDAMSAACMLDGYIEDGRLGAKKVIPCSFPPPKHLEIFDYSKVSNHVHKLYPNALSSKVRERINSIPVRKEELERRKHKHRKRN